MAAGKKIDKRKTIGSETKITENSPKRKKEHYEGHRTRLRKRFEKADGRDFDDYELLELLLFKSFARKDTKPLAKALIARFGSLAEVLNAEPKLLQEVEGCGPTLAFDLKIIRRIHERVCQTQFDPRDIFSAWDKVLSYLRAALAHEIVEQFRVMYLDKRNGLIREEIHQIGTIDHTSVYPREVIKRALDLGASGLILVHNHPSGNPKPSKEDINMTKEIYELSRGLGIKIIEHLIIGREGFSSFKQMGLL